MFLNYFILFGIFLDPLPHCYLVSALGLTLPLVDVIHERTIDITIKAIFATILILGDVFGNMQVLYKQVFPNSEAPPP